jgi:hypothetical protein
MQAFFALLISGVQAYGRWNRLKTSVNVSTGNGAARSPLRFGTFLNFWCNRAMNAMIAKEQSNRHAITFTVEGGFRSAIAIIRSLGK